MLNIGIASGIICAVFIVIGLFLGSRQMSIKHQLIWLSSLIVGTILIGQAIFGIGNLINREITLGGFHQFLNGTVVSAERENITCERDGDCSYTYQCDKETTVTLVPDGDGGLKTKTETTYHDCPYTTYEYRYWTVDSFASTTSFGNAISAEPVPWREGEIIPDSIPRGIPTDWQTARTALDQGYGLPMTKDAEYKNYILASNSNYYDAPSGVVDELLEAKLLPGIEQPLYGSFNVNKVSFVNYTPSDQDQWQTELMQLNAALGTEHGGDLRIVILRDRDIPSDISPDDYTSALRSYWTHDQGKNALAKNALVVVIALREGNHTVDWMRAMTGIPEGNESLIKTIDQSFSGQEFSLASILGETRATVEDRVVNYSYGQGSIAQTILVDTPFQAVCMENCGTSGGYDSLTVNPELDFWGYFGTIVITLVIVSFGWVPYLYYCRDESYY